MSFLDTIKKNRDAFLKYNEEKYRRFQGFISNTNIRRAVNAIPLMLCLNEKKIPGYVEGDVPRGIYGYKPDDDTLKFVKGRFHLTSLPLKNENPFIEMVAVMGSVGTIAYTKESDFDYWVCIDRRRATAAQLANFAKKVEGVRQWVMSEMKIEVTLFINDVESIKHNIFADEESAFGSTVGAVLKDEFYRTSTIVAGKVPFWWVIPRFITDAEYEVMYGKLPAEMKEKDFVDLGNLYEISKEDFLGAALFQLIKSLGNPFKSILKIGVLEKYLSGTEETPLLSQKVKLNILTGNLDNRILDSYILLFEEVYDYYDSMMEDKKLLSILRQNLYLKINPQLTKYVGMKNAQNLPYKVAVMFKYVKKWNWNLNDIKNLDNFDNWDYNSIMAFWNLVKKFMLLSYQKIARQLPTLSFSKKIPESDFKLLSRKIKTHFATEPNKIDNYITFKDIAHESILYIEPINKTVDEHEWRLFKRDTSADEKFKSATLRIESSLVKLLAWTAINEIFNPQFSRLKLQSGYTRINPNQVVEILTKIYTIFTKVSLKKNEYLLKPAFTIANMLLVNFNLENEERIKTVHHLYKTSWGESFIEEHERIEDIANILERMLRDAVHLKLPYESCCAVLSPEPFRKHYKEIETIFRECYEFIVGKKTSASHRLIAALRDSFLTAVRNDQGVTVSLYPDFFSMLTSASKDPQKELVNKFIGESQGIQVLQDLYKICVKNSVSVFWEDRKENAVIYIINEQGNIFTFTRPQMQKEEALMYCYGFSQNAIRSANNSPSVLKIRDEVKVYKLTVDKFGNRELDNLSKWCEEVYLLRYKSKPQLRAVIEPGENGKKKYCFVMPTGSRTEFLDFERIPHMFKKLQESGIALRKYVSEIQFGRTPLQMKEPDTTAFFAEKHRLEFLLDNYL